jgi:hypothetical protein
MVSQKERRAGQSAAAARNAAPSAAAPRNAAPSAAAPRNTANVKSVPSNEEIYRLIAETAYFKAKARGFEPGGEVRDWIEAEAEVRHRVERGAAR